MGRRSRDGRQSSYRQTSGTLSSAFLLLCSRVVAGLLTVRTSDRLVPFLLMLIIIEEIIPLVVLYAPGVLPSTCLLPSQKDRIDTKRRDKQKAFALNNRQLFEKLRQRLLANPTTPVRTLLDSPSLIALNGCVLYWLSEMICRHSVRQAFGTIHEWHRYPALPEAASASVGYC